MSTQQNARTPGDFKLAVEKKFKVKFVFDLACTMDDCVSPSGLIVPVVTGSVCGGYYHDIGYDALAENWDNIPQGRILEDGTEECAWLNPPWKNVYPWAKKCHVHAQGRYLGEVNDFEWQPNIRVFSLFPHGTSAAWRAELVQGEADIYNLAPRVPYLNPETGDFYRDEKGKPKCSQTDAILVDWAGTGEVYSWNWKQTLDDTDE